MPRKTPDPRHDQSGEHPTVQRSIPREGDPREAETLAPPGRSGLHHAVPLRKGPLVAPTIPKAPSIPRWIKGIAS
jgi:hypothetical protein